MTLSRYGVELRSEVAGNKLRGHAAVFEQVADLGPWGLERLAHGAFDKALAAEDCDVRALFNHDPSMPLGRQSAGTLRLTTDSEGLEFEVDLPDTTAGRDVREMVSAGLVTGASFAFIPDEDEWTRTGDGRQLRTHTSVRSLIDVSPVTFPAYEGASVALRRLDLARPDSRSQLIRARARVTLGRK